MNKIKMAVVAALIASTVGLQPASAIAQERDRRDRQEDRRDRREDRRDRQEDRRDRREDRRDRREDRWDRLEDRWDRREDRWDRLNDNRAVPRAWRRYDYNRHEPGYRSYDAARYYRYDSRYKPRRLGRNDRIYRGSDNRYYCRRDDGTTGLIVGGMAGGVLGQVIAPEDSKTLGTILGAGAGALIGRSIDRGDVVCR